MSKEKLNDLQHEIRGIEIVLNEAKHKFKALQLSMINAALDGHKHEGCACGVELPRRLLVSDWDCPTSPIGSCVYNLAQDPWHDECLFCEEPEERK